MACVRTLPPKQVQLYTTQKSSRYEWFTDWVPAVGLKRFGAVVNLRNLQGPFQLRLVRQVAEVRSEVPGAITSLGSFMASEDFHSVQSELSISDHLLVRFGIDYQSMEQNASAGAFASVEPTLSQCGRLLGGGSAQVNPGEMTATNINHFPLTGWSSCLGLDAFAAAFLVSNNLSDYLEYRLTARTAVDPNDPGVWRLFSSWVTPDPGSSELFTGTVAPTTLNIENNALFQVGVAVRKRAGASGNPRATIAGVVAARY